MLCLKRKRSEGIIFTLPDGTRGRVHVRRILGSRVDIGIDFPPEIEVNREELQILIDRETKTLEASCQL